jgi:hypothetical protein
VLIGGEAGVGKSRLVGEFGAQAAAGAARVLAGYCLDLSAEGLPFAPFTGVLRELVRELGADGLAALLPGQDGRDLARLLPELGEPIIGGIRARHGRGCSGRYSPCSGTWPRPGPWWWSSRMRTGPTGPRGICCLT